MFSRPVSSMFMPRLGSSSAFRLPLIRMWPITGSYIPASVRSSVVLPAPFMPISPSRSPLFKREGDVAQCLHHHALLHVLAQPAGGCGHHRLLQAAAAAVVQREEHRDAVMSMRASPAWLTSRKARAHARARRTATRPRTESRCRAARLSRPCSDGTAQQRRADDLEQREERIERQHPPAGPSCSGCQITGVRKKAICMTLPTIGPMSRNLAQNAPSSRQIASASTIHTAIPGSDSKRVQPGHISKIHDRRRPAPRCCAPAPAHCAPACARRAGTAACEPPGSCPLPG